MPSRKNMIKKKIIIIDLPTLLLTIQQFLEVIALMNSRPRVVQGDNRYNRNKTTIKSRRPKHIAPNSATGRVTNVENRT